MKWTLKKISILIYCISFVLPAFYLIIINRSLVFGYYAFLMGATFIREPNIYFLCWLANVAYLLSLVIKKYKLKLVFGVTAVLLSFLLPVGFVMTHERDYFLHVGYFTWIAAFLINLISIIKTHRVKNNTYVRHL